MSYQLPKVNKLLHGGDYNPEQWLDCPEILEKDLLYMKEAHVNVVTLGVFSWSIYEPEEGVFHFKWLDEIMDKLYANGIHVILATPSGARPAWLDKQYPQAMRVNEYGLYNTHGGRHNHCMSSPVYRSKVAAMDEMLARRYGQHPAVILWHISNEMGGACYCDECTRRFRKFLQNRYKTIDNLNHQWWTTFWSHRFTDFDQIDPPTPLGEQSIHGLNLDWRRFTTWNTADFLQEEIKVLRRWAPDIPVTTNFMRLYYGLDYHKMADKLDIISWDSYPAWGNTDESEEQMFLHTAFEHAFMRSMKRDRPFLLMESTPNLVNWHPFNKAKRPGMHKLTSLHAVACGSDSVLYFQWRKGRGSYEQFHGAVIDHLGTNDTRVFADVKEVGEILDSLEAVRGSVVKSQVAIIFDWENRWAIDDMAGLSGNKNYVETVRQVYEILLTHGIDADLLPADSDFTGYKAVIAPMLYMIKENTAKNLERFTAGGGQLLGTYLTGYVNENTLCWLGGFPGDGLRKLFGLYSEEIDTLYPEEKNSMCFEGKTFKLTDFCEILKTETAQVMGVYGDDFYAGSPVFTKNPWKMGCAWYIGARADTDGMTGILRQVCVAAGLEFEALPRGLMIHRRYKGEDKYIFYVNTAKEKISYHGKEIGPMCLLLYKEENGVGTWLDLC